MLSQNQTKPSKYRLHKTMIPLFRTPPPKILDLFEGTYKIGATVYVEGVIATRER